jgi:aconitase A
MLLASIRPAILSIIRIQDVEIPYRPARVILQDFTGVCVCVCVCVSESLCMRVRERKIERLKGTK